MDQVISPFLEDGAISYAGKNNWVPAQAAFLHNSHGLFVSVLSFCLAHQYFKQVETNNYFEALADPDPLCKQESISKRISAFR